MITDSRGICCLSHSAAQLFVIFMIIVVITVIPRQINRLVELSKLQHDYMHGYSVRKRSVQNGGHVVVTGHVSSESVGEFLAEFYRARQGRVNMDVVFLTDVAPTDRLQSLLLNAKYRRRVTYLKGSLLIDKDAKRACVEQAAAVFILAAKDNPKHADAADALTILQALAIDKYRFQNRVTGLSSSRRERDIRCFLQILSPQRTRGLRTITGAEVALNTPRLRTAILARSIVCPGATALLLNLISSASEHDVDEAKASNVLWAAEYAHGLQHQLFPVFLPRFYDGLLYENATELLYTQCVLRFLLSYLCVCVRTLCSLVCCCCCLPMTLDARSFSIIFVALYKLGAKDHGKRVRLSPFGQPLREEYVCACSGAVYKPVARGAIAKTDAVDRLSGAIASDIGFFIAPSASFAKHAVEALAVRELGARNKHSSQLPTLVFSSDNVLDRQSMVNERSPSVDLLSDASDDDEQDDGDGLMGGYHQQQQLESGTLGLSHHASALSIGPDVTLVHTRGRSSSSDSSSSSSSSSASSSSAPSTASTLMSHVPLLPPFARQQQSLPSVPASLLRRTSSILAAKVIERLHDHIVICGPFAHGYQIACYLAQLYRTERMDSQSSSGAMPTILLLVKRFPSDADFENLPAPLPPNVFVERGVSQNVEDLLRVRAFEAKAVLMIPGHWKYHVDEFREESLEELSDHLMDYQVIMSTLSLQTVHDLHHEHLRSSRTAASPHGLRRRLSSRGDGRSSTFNKLTLGCSVVRSHDSIKYFAYKSSQSHHGHGLHRAPSARLTRCSGRFALSAKRARCEDVSGVEAELLLPAAFAPSYAAGEVFVDSVLDTLLCQSFFNPYVIDLVHALAGDYFASSDHCTSASGSPFASSMMKYFTKTPETRGPLAASSGSSSSPGTTQTTQSSGRSSRYGSGELPSSRSGDPDSSDDTGVHDGASTAADELPANDSARHRVLSTAAVANRLDGEPFKTVFTRGLEQGVLVLGIYRRANNPRRGNTLPYVFTCPSSDASHTVERGDSLYILSKCHTPVIIE